MTTLDIGGVEYAPLDSSAHSVGYDVYMAGVLQASGLVALLEQQAGGAAVSTDQALAALSDSGYLGAVAAGMVRPAGRRWTTEWAKAAAQALNGPLPATDRAKLRLILTEGLALFFPAGPRSWVTSH